jgi:hypothetical protein
MSDTRAAVRISSRIASTRVAAVSSSSDRFNYLILPKWLPLASESGLATIFIKFTPLNIQAAAPPGRSLVFNSLEPERTMMHRTAAQCTDLKSASFYRSGFRWPYLLWAQRQAFLLGEDTIADKLWAAASPADTTFVPLQTNARNVGRFPPGYSGPKGTKPDMDLGSSMCTLIKR